MKPSIKDQLSGIKLDTSEYGWLPIREDVLCFDPDNGTQKQWEKLNIIRKNLKVVNKYIHPNKGESINDWITQTGNNGISKIVLSSIGKHNDETKGITAYFINLQKFYDQEEEKYDTLEENAGINTDMKLAISELRDERKEKRKIRRSARKLKLRDLKKDGNGYLVVGDEEEPHKIEEKNEIKEQKESVLQTQELIKNSKKRIRVWLVGAFITITAISLIASLSKKQ